MPGTFSISDSSYTDWALSVTGPYESTAMVTGPMPRKPKATRPNAKMAGAIISAPSPVGNWLLIHAAMPIRKVMVIPIQYALKFPATSPDRTLSDPPPSREAMTISRTWRDSVEVKTLTSSGMIAPASVPQVMIVESFHHIDVSPPKLG